MIIHLQNTSTQLFLLIWNVWYNKSSLLLQLVAMNIYGIQSPRGVPWNQIKSENVKTLFLFSALKEPAQVDCKKACSVMEQAWIQHSADIFVKNIFINPFRGTGLFQYSLKHIFS